MMGIEIERKFLVSGEGWREEGRGIPFRQGYLQHGSCTVRVRTEGERGVLTIKGPVHGISRAEYEYEIPFSDAEAMLDTLVDGLVIRKVRHTVFYRGKAWVVDVFGEENAGLIVAEIELESEDEAFDLPPWVGEEVTHDRRYSNAQLAEHPFSTWKSSIKVASPTA